VAVRRTRTGRRRLRVRLELGARAEVTATLTRGGRTLASASRQLGPGSRRLDLALPGSVARGPARLELVVASGEGDTLTLSDTVRVPRARRRA
jgi:hypothetical protein